RPVRRGGPVPLPVPAEIPDDLDGSGEGGGGGHQYTAVGLPVLRVVRFRGDLERGDRRCAAGVLLPDCAVGGGDAVLREGGNAAGDRVDDGHAGLGAGGVSLAEDRLADGGDDRLHVRAGADTDVAISRVLHEKDFRVA